MGMFRDYLNESLTKENEKSFWNSIDKLTDKETMQEIRDYYTEHYDRSVFDNYNYARFKKEIFKKFNLK